LNNDVHDSKLSVFSGWNLMSITFNINTLHVN